MFLSLLLSLFQLVQQELPIPKVISTQAGLSNNIVYDTYQDHEGFIWIATDNGLNRFDGYNFKVFYHDTEDSTSVSNNVVRSILEDLNGNLWIGTLDGLNLYHRKTETFKHFDTTQDIPNDRLDIQHMYLDNQGIIWFNNLNTIGWFDTNTLAFGFIDSSYSASTLAIDGRNGIWMSSNSGTLEKFRVDTKSIHLIKKNDNTDKIPLHWGSYSNSLWIKHNSFSDSFEVKTSILPKLPNDVFAKELLETDENTLWIGTEIGLFIYFKDSQELKSIDLGNSSTLSSAIRSIDSDRNGGVWVGTLSGLFHFDSFQKPFEHIDIVNASSDVVMGIESSSQTIYANALGLGLYTYDLKSGQVKKKQFSQKAPEGFNFIWNIETVPESDFPLWLATDAGLLLYNPKNGNWKDVKLPRSIGKTNPSFSILKTDNGYNWVSSKEGVHQVSKRDGRIIKSKPLQELTKASLIQDQSLIGDQLYIATEGVGILIYDIKSESVQFLSTVVPASKIISSTPIWELFKDNKTLWIGTNRGLFSLNTESNDFKQVTTVPSLENRVIFSIDQDQNGTLWMGTEKGLASFNPQNKKTRFYNENDGLKNIEFNRKSVRQTSEGQLLFGGVNGITAFYPDQIQQNTIVPSLHITDIEVITSDSTFSPTLEETDKLTLPWHQNTVQVSYVALNYTNSSQNQYRHQLVGHDPDWVENKGTRQARYVKLPPGDYTFEVMGSNNDGLWNPEAKSIIIEILPPFWQTWWFRSVVVITVLLILWGLYRYRVKKLLEVERMRLRIAGDLHDEVGSGLSGIALTGDLLQRQLKNGRARPELVERITKNARNLASSLDSIVWLIDPNKESLGDLLMKTHAVGTELLNQSKFEMSDQLNETDRLKSLSADQKRHLFLFMKEGFNNIAKHAEAECASLTVRLKNNELTIILKDNGIGFDIKEKEKGHGLGSLSNRAGLLNAQLTLNSSAEKGTAISLKMKLP
ncbi:ligand-binding sensor domain-containing protein [Roseivirga sp.]|uniref:ligand-binding sensor domain-containing protein n=1 Tax=Roseivirga sp. TaxID=1964215 RepID=UPI003B8DCD7A